MLQAAQVTPSAAYKANAEEVLAKIGAVKVVPVIALDSADDAVPLAHALKYTRPTPPHPLPAAAASPASDRAARCRREGGIPIMEVTFRTDAAEDSLLALQAAAIPGMCIGAGTVLTVEHAEAALAAGAEFVISPGVNPEVVSFCIDRDVPVFPGIATPTDIQAAMNLGCETLKFFPAEANGGIPTLTALAAVFSMVSFMPTGGITADNIAEYLAIPAVCACGGTWMVKPDMIAAGDFAEITSLSKEAVAAAGEA